MAFPISHPLLPLILVIELAPQILSSSVPDRDMLFLNAIGTYRSNAVRERGAGELESFL